MLGQVLVAAATAIVGYDLCQNETWNISSRRRVIQGIAFVGSAAINDTEIDLFVEDKKIGHFFNTRGGVLAPLQEDAIPLGRIYVPPGSKIAAIVTVAPGTSPVILRLY
ncbi:hypothetical protein ES703_84672 [subsurface metagenome]